MTYIEAKTAIHDPVYPGEQWFCYWKTSRSLWSNYINSIPEGTSVIVPIFWGFHYDERGGWDLEQGVAEKDLKGLIDLLQKDSRRFCFLIPLTPAPFLPNGGVPVSGARVQSLDLNGIIKSVIDSDGRFNKVYSYFDPKILLLFSEFCSALSKMLRGVAIQCKIHGVLFEYLESGQFHSYFTDRSPAFDQGFSRFLKKTYEGEVDISSPKQEDFLKNQFSQQVQELFFSCVKENFQQIGEPITISLIGGSAKDTIQRNLSEGLSPIDILDQVDENFFSNNWPSTILLSSEEKSRIVTDILSEHFGEDKISTLFFNDDKIKKSLDQWVDLELVSIFDREIELFKKQGLYDFLEDNFRWSFKKYDSFNFSQKIFFRNEESVKIFHSQKILESDFSKILKLFLLGHIVILDDQFLDPGLKKKLDLFFLENDLLPEKIHADVMIQYCSLQRGALILYDGKELNRENGINFWQKIFNFLNLPIVKVDRGESICGFWRVRKTASHELNFLNVRRLNIYNPTSYKKNITLSPKERLVFMKIVDPSQASIKSYSHVIDVELLPGGKIALDFGQYEDKA
jgi:hypothetical protein